MKLLIVGDLHGSIPRILFEDYDAMMAPGDFCSSSVNYNGFDLRKLVFSAFMKRKERRLEYCWRDECGKEAWQELVKKSKNEGRKVLEALNSLGKPVFVVPGNWDSCEINEPYNSTSLDNYLEITSGLPNIHDCFLKGTEFEGFRIIGYGVAPNPEFPWLDPRWALRGEKECLHFIEFFRYARERLESLFESSKEEKVIFLSHPVPYRTMDAMTNPDFPFGVPSGSVIARNMIVRYKPLACIGAHMHEYLGTYQLGATKVVVPGFGPCVNVLLDITKEGVRSVEIKHYINS